EPYSENNIDPKVQSEIDECIAYADALRARGIDVRVVVETVAREEVERSARGTVEVREDRVMHPVVSYDIPEPAQEEGAIEATYETLGDLRISELEQYNTRLKGMLDVASQRIGRLEACAKKIMPNTRSGATMTREAVNELIERRVKEALEARDAARNLEPFVESGGEQGDENGDNYEGGNGGGNRNGVGNGNGVGNKNGGVKENGGNGNGRGNSNGNGGGYGHNFRGLMHVARECTYQDFLKCQPLNFNGTEGVIGLTRWFEKMKT
ncbi:hypothetical protein Tco_1307762, partial [Tanacetum coccineum]